MSLDIVTTVTVEAVSYDLVDIRTVKDDLEIPQGDTAKDEWLARTISAVSSAIHRYCDRTFVIETLQDQFNLGAGPRPYPSGAGRLQLARWPLALFAQPVTTADAATGTTILQLSDTSAIVDGASASGLNIPAGTIVVAGDTTPTAATMSQPTAGDLPQGSTVAFGLTVTQSLLNGTTQQLSPGIDYAIDARRAQLLRLNPDTGLVTAWEALPVTVAYSAGYETIPADLIDAALLWVTLRFKALGRDPMLREETQPGLGTQVFWVGGPPKSGSVPLEIAAMLDLYRMPVFG